jgi:hypothetical protein
MAVNHEKEATINSLIAYDSSSESPSWTILGNLTKEEQELLHEVWNAKSGYKRHVRNLLLRMAQMRLYYPIPSEGMALVGKNGWEVVMRQAEVEEVGLALAKEIVAIKALAVQGVLKAMREANEKRLSNHDTAVAILAELVRMAKNHST